MDTPYLSRIERDFLGEKQIPLNAYWGIHTARALENFSISDQTIGSMHHLIIALTYVKKAAALANMEFGILDRSRGEAILWACGELLAGKWYEQFVVDAIQGGAGTSTNMNTNEVIANLALERLGYPKGKYDHLHPIDHVNASQSTNDVYPTALRLAAWLAIDELLSAMSELRKSFERKATEFEPILKIGRTQLQDAVPMSLGHEFLSFAIMLGEDELRLREARALISEINLGGTAIGTGINAPLGYAQRAVVLLSEVSKVPVIAAENLIEATQDTGAFVQLSGVLKRIACKLSKVCNDLRLLSSGPQAGFCEIFLPARQAGSSIMPGKVNPVIPEVVNQVAFEVIGNDLTISMASEAGQLQLNAFEPIISWSLHKSLKHLTKAAYTLKVNCIDGIQANKELLAQRVARSATVATALNPFIGYENSARLAKAALASGKTIIELAQELALFQPGEAGKLLEPQNLLKPFPRKKAKPELS